MIESSPVHGSPAFTLENEFVTATVLVGKGADILSFSDKSSGIDALWRPRWGRQHFSASRFHPNSATAWLAACAGGWNLMFPSSGAESLVRGGFQPDHGEASVVPWSVEEVIDDTVCAALKLSTHLFGSPFRIDRVVTLRSQSRTLDVIDTFTNEGGIPFPYTATHHPTLGTPFLDAGCNFDSNAVDVIVDDDYNPPHCPWPAGHRTTWNAARETLGLFPPRGAPRQILAYLTFDPGDAWYRVTNTRLGLAFHVAWQASDFPYAWVFQECDGSPDFPWFGNTYVAAIEPSTSFPARGLAYGEAHGAVDYLAPGQSVSLALSASLGPPSELITAPMDQT